MIHLLPNATRPDLEAILLQHRPQPEARGAEGCAGCANAERTTRFPCQLYLVAKYTIDLEREVQGEVLQLTNATIEAE